MGKKKSVVLMVLLTIVIVVLTALTIFPSFAVPGTVKSWNPVVLQYDFGSDLDGGSYMYYYPEGVIPETEYQNRLLDLQAEIDAAIEDGDAEAEARAREDLDEYTNSYRVHPDKGICLSTEEKYGIFDNDGVSEEFKQSFDAMAREITARYEEKGYSDYRVAVVDNYSIRVELPLSENNAGNVYSLLAMTGEVTLTVDDELVDEMKNDVAITNLIDSVSVGVKYKTAYLSVKFTSEGKAMLERLEGTITESSASEAKGLVVKVGENTVTTIYTDALLDTKREARLMGYSEENKNVVETYSILLNSALDNPVDLKIDTTRMESRVFEPVYGSNVVTLLYIALGVVLLATIVLPIVKMGRFGLVSVYSSFSYLIIVGICFKYITGGVFEITLGSVLIFLLGLAVINVLQYLVYNEIIAKAKEGKTMGPATKAGYKNSIWTCVDVYVVLLLGALALLLGVGGLYTFALQAIICTVAAAFISLLWSRFINYTFFSASKNPYKYYRFKKEVSIDDED